LAELQLLLDRIKPKPQRRVRSKRNNGKISPEMSALLTRINDRRWKAEALELIREFIRATADDVWLARHIRECEMCYAESMLSIERYRSRGLPWFLFQDDEWEDEDDSPLEVHQRFKGFPRIRDYYIPSYWEEAESLRAGRPISHSGTNDFIKARLEWGEKVSRQNLVLACNFYKLLNSWNLTGDRPSYDFEEWYFPGAPIMPI
jgi:hypothetical protein